MDIEALLNANALYLVAPTETDGEIGPGVTGALSVRYEAAGQAAYLVVMPLDAPAPVNGLRLQVRLAPET